MERIIEEFNAGIENAENTIIAYKGEIDAAIAAFEASVNAEITAHETAVDVRMDAAEADINTAKTGWQTLFNQFMADVEAELAALNDAAMGGLIGNPASNTAVALDTKYSVLRGLFNGTDETATLQSAVTAAAGGTLIIPANKTMKSTKITVPAAGITIRGHGKGSVLDYIDGGTASECLFEAIGVTGFTVENCTIKASNAVARTSVWGLLRARQTTDFNVRNVWFGKSTSCAIWTSEVTDFRISNVHIDGTYADGIHISRGSKRGLIEHVKAYNLGDDIVGINAYTNDGATNYAQIEDIVVNDIQGYNIGTGRGVAINGCKDIFVSNILLDGIAQAGVLVAIDAGTYTSNSNISIEHVNAVNTGQDVPGGGTSGAVYVTEVENVLIRDVRGGAVAFSTTAKGVIWDERPPGEFSTGQAVVPRELIQSSKAMSSGAVFLSFFTAIRADVIGKIRTYTDTTAAGATPTLVRLGLYEVSALGDLTLVASTANDTTLYAAASTVYEKALSASYTLRKGQRYAVGIIVVTAATVPTLAATNSSVLTAELAKTPRINGVLSGQADLPASILAANIGATAQRVYSAIIP
jgi:hypothetical protein